MKKLDPANSLKIFDIKLRSYTAGPSPDNNSRTEIFLLGCKKALEGDACPGCFNSSTWNISKAEWGYDPVELAADLNENAPNKYITIGGGEPTDQLDNLIILCRELKQYGFHIMMYTWRDLWKIRRGYCTKDMTDNNNKYPISPSKFEELIKYIDIVVDGEYDPKQRLYVDEKTDGFYGSVGSGNQKIWDVNEMEYRYMKDIKGLRLRENNTLEYIE